MSMEQARIENRTGEDREGHNGHMKIVFIVLEKMFFDVKTKESEERVSEREMKL